MSDPHTVIAQLSPGTLATAVKQRSTAAIRVGALSPIHTEATTINDGGVTFTVRIALNLRRKASQSKHPKAPLNPFLPPEPLLTVARVPPRHIAVLNKFNVVEDHLLLVTDRFVPQEALLDTADFEALWRCMAEYPALGFYNGGTVAGASQGHKHLQLIPLPLAAQGPAVPIEAVLDALPPTGTIHHASGLPFAHRICGLPAMDRYSARHGAALWERIYRELLQELDIGVGRLGGLSVQRTPYNLLLTRDWMMVVPRHREQVGTISLNAMAFAGSLFVMDHEQLALVRRTGPMRMLCEVS